jgi:hypothetical protein
VVTTNPTKPALKKKSNKTLPARSGRRFRIVTATPPRRASLVNELVGEDDGRLVFTRTERSTLNLWSMEADPNGHVRWTQTRAI